MQYLIGALFGVAITAIALSLWDLFFKKDDLEEMTWIPLDEDGRV